MKLTNQQRAFSGTAEVGFSVAFTFKGGAICRHGGGEMAGTTVPERHKHS